MRALRPFVWACLHCGLGLHLTGQVTFRTSAQLVVETVSVKDGDGQPIKGLTVEDFTITEDGVPQSIAFVEYQELEAGSADRGSPPAIRSSNVRIGKLTRTQIAPERPGDIGYRDRRLLALYFDMSAMPLPDQWRACTAALTFIRTQMTSSDLIAIIMYSEGRVQVLEDFTNDRDQLESTIETLIAGEDDEASGNGQSGAEAATTFGQNTVEFDIFNRDRQLGALQTAVNMLGHLNEKKSLIYFASGLRLNGFDNQAQLNATINAAIRAGVSLYPIDARGLIAQAPLGDANRRSPGGISMYSGASALAGTTALQRSQDTLWTLAADTGGKALLDYNDLSRGIVEAQRAITSYYIIGYYTSKTNSDGKFRRLTISLKNPRGAKLEYRQGYYGPKEFKNFSATDRERQLEEALMLPDPITDLTVAMEINYFQLSPAEYFVPIVIRIPGRELALAAGRQTRLDIIAEIKESNVTISNLRDKIELKMDGAAAANWAQRPIEYDTGFTLLPGEYKIKFLAREGQTGHIGTYETQFTIPNLSKEEQQVPISSVVLSSQRINLRDALYNVGKEKGQAIQLANPLVEEGHKLVPSVTRVFSRRKQMYVYLEAYQERRTVAQPLAAYVTFYRGSEKVLETKPLQINEPGRNAVKPTPFRFSIALEKLPPGEYNCLVTVLDPSSEKAAFWQAPIVLLP